MPIDLETAVQQFLDTAREMQADAALTAEVVLQRVIKNYRDVRIDGAELDSDGDMLLLQWGAGSQLASDAPMDCRTAADDDAAFEDSKRQYIDFTRQVFAAGDDDDAEFDDLAVQLSLTLVYGPATGNEPSSNQWIGDLRRIDREIAKFTSDPFVQSLLATPATRLVATVQHCG